MLDTSESRCWKVIKPLVHRLASACVVAREPCSATYQVGKWTVPPIPGSKLFACDNLQDALAFRVNRLGNERLIIYEAVAEGAESVALIARFPNEVWIRRFWDGTISKDKLAIVEPPRGTIQCARIKLVKQVNLREARLLSRPAAMKAKTRA